MAVSLSALKENIKSRFPERLSVPALLPVSVLEKIDRYISARAFVQGMAVVIGLYALIFAYITINAEHTLKTMESTLASTNVQIEKLSVAQHENMEDQHSTNIVPLAPAPMAGVYEETRDGSRLPRISREGLTPFMAYKKPFEKTKNATVSIVLMDFGLSKTLSERAIAELPDNVTFILSPYADNPRIWQEKARAQGHEVWLHLPLQTASYPNGHDPGPYGIFSHGSLKKNKDLLKRILSRTTGYSGVASFTDHSFDGNDSILRGIMNFIFSRGLGFLELNPQTQSRVAALAKEYGGAYGHNHVKPTDMSLKDLERMIQKKYNLITTIQLYPKTLDALKIWIKTLEGKHIDLAPLTAQMDPPKAIPTPEPAKLSLPMAAPSHGSGHDENHEQKQDHKKHDPGHGDGHH